MTVTLPKRLFEDASSLTSPPASKKLRVLAPLTEQLSATCHIKPGVAGLGSLQQHQQQLSAARKRRHDTGSAGGSAVSPSNSGKRVSTMFISRFTALQLLFSHATMSAEAVAVVNPQHLWPASNSAWWGALCMVLL